MSKLSVDTFRMIESISIGRFKSELKILISAKGKICNNATYAGQVKLKVEIQRGKLASPCPFYMAPPETKHMLILPYGYDRLFIGRLNMTQFYN